MAKKKAAKKVMKKAAKPVTKITKKSPVKKKAVKPKSAVTKKAVKKVGKIVRETIKKEDTKRSVRNKAGLVTTEITKGKGPLLHGICKARAGTGKTFTGVIGVANLFRSQVWGDVVRGLGFSPEPSVQQAKVWEFLKKAEKPRSVVYCAFNNSIVKDFERKYQFLVAALERINIKLEFKTIHALNFRLVAQTYQLKGWKVSNKYNSRNMLEMMWPGDINEVMKEKFDTFRAIEQMLTQVKLNLAHEVLDGNGQPPKFVLTHDRMVELAEYYDISINHKGEDSEEEILLWVNRLLNESTNNPAEMTGKIDFNDQIFLPVANGLNPKWIYDLAIIDEAQDLNPCQQVAVLKHVKRVLMIGDEKQAIYGFAGADTESMNTMQGRLLETGSVEQMDLTVTRRCGKAIVEAVKHIVPDFEAHQGNSLGEVINLELEEVMNDLARIGHKDMVLCRVNAPLTALAFTMLKAGRKCHIQGREFADQIKVFIKSSGATSVNQMLEWLDTTEEQQRQRLARRNNPDLIVALEDKCACVRVFAEGSIELEDVYQNIDKVFATKFDENGNEVGEGTKLTSIHRAKGLESNTVFLLRPDLLPHPMAKKGWAKEQEANLEYVAKTRAINTLVYVNGQTKMKEM